MPGLCRHAAALPALEIVGEEAQRAHSWSCGHAYPPIDCLKGLFQTEAVPNNTDWRRLKNEDPEAFAKAVAFERAYQRAKGATTHNKSELFLHRSCVPLDQVDLSTDIDRGQGMLAGFGNECEGMCGV